MDQETRRKIEETVIDVLKESNIEDTTEHKVRVQAEERLGIGLSDMESKLLVRNVVESFLLSIMEREAKGKEGEPGPSVRYETKKVEQEIVPKKGMIYDDGDHVICQLSKNRRVTVQEFKGHTLVSIRQYYEKDGKKLPTPTGISLSTEQWSAFKSSIPAIEEAILQMKRKIRSKCDGDKVDAISDPTTKVTSPKFPIETIRFDGKNYRVWARQMEFLLRRLKIAYVLSDQSPTTVLGPESSSENAARSMATEQKWMSDNDISRHILLNSLSDSLFHQYSKKTMSARELWMELKLLYRFEEFSTKRSQVKKYLEFRMVERKSILEQVEELNDIADAIFSAGMRIDEDFHVSVIISKLPPSWKNVCVKLMHEEHLPLVKLIDRLRTEERLRTEQNSHLSGVSSSNPGGQRPAVNHMKDGLGMEEQLHTQQNSYVSGASSSRQGQRPAANEMIGRLRIDEQLCTEQNSHLSGASLNPGGQHPAANDMSKTRDPKFETLPLRKMEWKMEVKTLLCLDCGKEGHISQNCSSRKE